MWNSTKEKENKRADSCIQSRIAVAVLVAQSCLTLCNPMNCSLPGSFCPWDFPGSGLPCLLSGDLPDPGLKPMSFVSPALAGRFFTTALSGKPPMNTGTYYSPSLSKVCLRARKQLMWTVWEPGLGPHPG